jgi:hypothetical protein
MATIMLADAAQVVDNKLYMLGAGWSIIGPEPIPFAIAVALKVPWDETDRPHVMRIELLDSDGHPVLAPMPFEGEPVVIESGFQVGRPLATPPGTPADLSLAINFGPIPLEPGGRYEWRLSIDGYAEAHWHAAFSTRAALPDVPGS